MEKIKKLYPESGVELRPLVARFYDSWMNIFSLGFYKQFINKAIAEIKLQPDDAILDLGCGTGRNAALMLNYLNHRGRLVGRDISPIMKKQFEKRFRNDKRVRFIEQRIDVPFQLDETFSVVFISFVLHGFPQNVREIILDNVQRHLKKGGKFVLLDFAEFDMNTMPWLHRFIFTHVECPYAFDFIKRDWKKLLEERNFSILQETFYVKNYVRLLQTIKK